MILKKCLLTANECYKKATKMTNNKPTGIVVHSTGANNPSIKRYVQPLTTDSDYQTIIDDIGKNSYNNHWNKVMDRKVCVHAFIGKNAKGIVETYQTLPFDICCWGVGSGSKGSYNYNPQARIQFEICEDNLTNEDYFNKAMKEAQEFCAYLCKEYGFGVDKISSHKESYSQGYGGNHEDPHNWLVKFGKNMDWFRNEVNKLLKENVSVNGNDVTSNINAYDATNYSTYVDEKLIYDYLKEVSGLNSAAITGILSNLKAESAFISTNLQTSYEKKLGYTDETYTKSVDDGSYDNFVRDSAGYGLAQWTYWSRKQALLGYAKSNSKSIGDYKMQLNYLLVELKGYKDLWEYFTTCENNEDSAYTCGYRLCYEFERPASKETSSITRGNTAKEYFNKYRTSVDVVVEPEKESQVVENNGVISFDNINIGDTYYFSGKTQYKSSITTLGSKAVSGIVKVTQKAAKNSNHPIHVRTVDNNGNFIKGTYGWVDISELFNNVNPYKVKITASALNYRKGPSTNYDVVGVIKDKGVYTIVDENNGWGLLKSYIKNRDGWINLSYTKKL